MLIDFILNVVSAFNIIYLWAILSKRNDYLLKLFFIVVGTSIIAIIIEYFNVYFMLEYVVYILAIKIAYKQKFNEIISEFFLAILIVIIFELFLEFCFIKFISDSSIRFIIIELVIGMIIVVLSKVKLINKYVIVFYNRFKKENGKIVSYFALTLSMYIFFIRFLCNYSIELIENNILIVIGLLILLIICQIFTYIDIIKSIKEKEELKISSEYSSAIGEIVQEIKQRQHDFNNYKNTIKGIVNVVEEKDIKETINNYIKDEDEYDNKINSLIYIDNVVIRSIIYRNMCRFKKNNINFEYEIQNNVLDDILSYTEISNVLGNLLNNAFEEVVKEECMDKNIEIRIFKENGIANLITENSIVSSDNINLNKMFTRGYSTKNENKRGYGLYNVQAITNNHKGYIKLNIEHKKVIFHIYFNNSSG